MAGHLHDLAMASEFLATTQFFTSNYQPLFIGGHYYIMQNYIMSALLYCHRQHKSVLNNDHQCNFLICCFNMLPWATIFQHQGTFNFQLSGTLNFLLNDGLLLTTCINSHSAVLYIIIIILSLLLRYTVGMNDECNRSGLTL